jgi:hypothetical protein
MGRNVFLVNGECDQCKNTIHNSIECKECKVCGRMISHLGKFSYGWRFLFKINDEIKSMNCIENLVNCANMVIIDEYLNLIEFKTFMDDVNSKSNDREWKLSEYNKHTSYDTTLAAFY